MIDRFYSEREKLPPASHVVIPIARELETIIGNLEGTKLGKSVALSVLKGFSAFDTNKVGYLEGIGHNASQFSGEIRTNLARELREAMDVLNPVHFVEKPRVIQEAFGHLRIPIARSLGNLFKLNQSAV